MGKTKENKKPRKGKHKEKTTLGDIVFRVIVIVAIFFSVLITYAFYIRDIIVKLSVDKDTMTTQIQKYE